jgi:hypothetical protein
MILISKTLSTEQEGRPLEDLICEALLDGDQMCPGKIISYFKVVQSTHTFSIIYFLLLNQPNVHIMYIIIYIIIIIIIKLYHYIYYLCIWLL